MPSAPPRTCSRCRRTVPKGQRCPCKPAWEGSTHPSDTAAWQKLRAAKIAASPICERLACRHPAVEVDHVIPNAEDPTLRYVWSNLQSLCHAHHAEKTRADAQRGKTRLR